MDLIVYFLVGVLQDFLLTLNWRYVAKNKAAPATFFSFLTTVVSLLVFYNILTQLDETRTVGAILIYAFGIGCGTFLGMKFKAGLKE